MILAKAVELFDKERVNSVPYETKIEWISQLDMKISSDFSEPRGGEKFNGYNETVSPKMKLKAPEAYREIYGLYLNMKLDYLNGEIARFNNSAILFNKLYVEMGNYINRNEKVLSNTVLKAGALYV